MSILLDIDADLVKAKLSQVSKAIEYLNVRLEHAIQEDNTPLVQSLSKDVLRFHKDQAALLKEARFYLTSDEVVGILSEYESYTMKAVKVIAPEKAAEIANLAVDLRAQEESG